MLKRIIEWYKKNKCTIWQGVCIVALCIAFLSICSGCSSFSASDGDISSQFGYNNVSIGGNACATSL